MSGDSFGAGLFFGHLPGNWQISPARTVSKNSISPSVNGLRVPGVISPGAPGAQSGGSISGAHELDERGMLEKEVYTYKNLLFRPLILHLLDLQQKTADVSDLILVPCFNCMFQGSFIKLLCQVHVTLDLRR